MLPEWATPLVLPEVPHAGGDVPRLEAYAESIPAFAEMAACPQESAYHGEGDVLTHTELVAHELISDPRWQSMGAEEREEMWWAALLHDCGKPQTTRFEDGRLRSPNHALRGAVLARQILWRAGVEVLRRERVCALVRYHMIPYHLFDREDPTRLTIELSLSCQASHLAILTTADSRGRLAEDNDRRAEEVDLFSDFAEELGCLERPYPFASDHARVMYFRRSEREPSYAAYDDSRGEIVILSGLPGAGKDSWVSANVAGRVVVSLDTLRREYNVKRGDRRGEGRVKAEAREMLREELRAGRSVIHNATNLSHQMRRPLLALADDYDARVHIVCVEATPEALVKQNRSRAETVPEEAIGKSLLPRWEAPTLAEAHALLFTSVQ